MALAGWMRMVVQVLHEILSLLMNDPNEVATDACMTSLNVAAISESSSFHITEALVTTLVDVLGLRVPPAVSVLTGLPVAVALLLRITEVIPADVLLFLIVSGICGWMVVLLVFIVLLCRCIKGCSKSLGDVRILRTMRMMTMTREMFSKLL